MKKRLLVAAALLPAALALCVAASPAVAITQGQLDGDGTRTSGSSLRSVKEICTSSARGRSSLRKSR